MASDEYAADLECVSGHPSIPMVSVGVEHAGGSDPIGRWYQCPHCRKQQLYMGTAICDEDEAIELVHREAARNAAK